MPQTPHVETHFTSSEKIRDIVIGMSDGLQGHLHGQEAAPQRLADGGRRGAGGRGGVRDREVDCVDPCRPGPAECTDDDRDSRLGLEADAKTRIP
jgi:hypothetical protein